MDNPCSDRCPTYAICKPRDAVERFRVCQHFKEYVDTTISESQLSVDKEHGKGKTTVVGVKVKGTQLIIDRNGNSI